MLAKFSDTPAKRLQGRLHASMRAGIMIMILETMSIIDVPDPVVGRVASPAHSDTRTSDCASEVLVQVPDCSPRKLLL
jgi:hypothetical protein